MANSTPDGTASGDLVRRLRRELTAGQVMEIAMTCAVLAGMAKLLFTLDLAEREPYCTFPSPHA